MTSGESGELIWTRPEPGSRRPRFTRDQIAATALAIADTEGFSAVSMRRIAAELGAGTMTLYYYVRTKDELVALMDDAIMAEVLIPPEELPAHWYDALTAVATRTWEVLMRHPWALHALQNAPRGPNSMRHFEQSLAAVAGTGLDASEKLRLITLVDDYVRGNVLRCGELRAGREGGSAEAAEEFQRYAAAQLATGEFPHTAALFGDLAGEDPEAAYSSLMGGMSDRDVFRSGLALLLRGAADRLGLSLPGR
jgi:Transcriptional regulator